MQPFSAQDRWLSGRLRSLAVVKFLFLATFLASRLDAADSGNAPYDYPFPVSPGTETFEFRLPAEYSTPEPVSSIPNSLGFGNVHINFDTPAGYLQGFRDYLNYLSGSTIGTQVGPIAYVGNYGGTVNPGLGNGAITFFRLTDDIDQDGIPGAVIVVDPVSGQMSTIDTCLVGIAPRQHLSQRQSNKFLPAEHGTGRPGKSELVRAIRNLRHRSGPLSRRHFAEALTRQNSAPATTGSAASRRGSPPGGPPDRPLPTLQPASPLQRAGEQGRASRSAAHDAARRAPFH